MIALGRDIVAGLVFLAAVLVILAALSLADVRP